MTFEASIYGLNLHANVRVPGLSMREARREPDVRVWLGLMPDWLPDALEGQRRVRYLSEYRDECGAHGLVVWEVADGDYLHLRYLDGTEFVIDRDGTQIWATWPGEALTLEDTAVYLLGPVLGQVLGLRGVTCLHASAVAVDGSAVALVGPAGAGKSTTAAAFARRGYHVLSDDVLTLDDRADGFMVHPAYPLLRLWEPSVEALFGTGDALPLLMPTWDKRYLDLKTDGHRFQHQPLPLAALYILGERTDDPRAPSVEELPAGSRIITLVANSYAARYLDNVMRGRELEVLGRVASGVPLRLVRPHADIANLSGLCDAILADFESLNRSAVAGALRCV